MRHGHTARRALLPLVGLMLSGCFAVNDPAAHEPGPVEAGEFCTAFAEIFCQSRDCGSCPPARGDPTDPFAMCETGFGNYCQQLYGSLLTDPRTGYDRNEMALQLAVGRQLLQQCDESFWAWTARADGLFAGFTGTVPTGGSCEPEFEETDQRRDTARLFACEGTDVCLEAATGWRCQSRLPEGASCYRGQCEPGLTCVGHNTADRLEQGVCGTTLAGDGEPCDESSDCNSSSCQFAFNDGRCLSTEITYCSLRSQCSPSLFVLGSDTSGPIAEGGNCEALVVCMSTAQATTSPASTMCRPVDPSAPEGTVDAFCRGYDQVCIGTPGELDRTAADGLCRASTMVPPPIFYCGPA